MLTCRSLVTALSGVCVALGVLTYFQRRITAVEEELQQERRKRHDERVGRTKAERELREGSQAAQNDQDFPCAIIGYLDSAFRTRNGTPRQGNVCPTSRAFVKLDDKICPSESLENLAEFTHVWLIFVFHEACHILAPSWSICMCACPYGCCTTAQLFSCLQISTLHDPDPIPDPRTPTTARPTGARTGRPNSKAR